VQKVWTGFMQIHCIEFTYYVKTHFTCVSPSCFSDGKRSVHCAMVNLHTRRGFDLSILFTPWHRWRGFPVNANSKLRSVSRPDQLGISKLIVILNARCFQLISANYRRRWLRWFRDRSWSRIWLWKNRCYEIARTLPKLTDRVLGDYTKLVFSAFCHAIHFQHGVRDIPINSFYPPTLR